MLQQKTDTRYNESIPGGGKTVHLPATTTPPGAFKNIVQLLMTFQTRLQARARR